MVTFFTTVKFCSHGNMPVPFHWMNPNVSCYDGRVQCVPYHCIPVRVAVENLKTLRKTFFSRIWASHAIYKLNPHRASLEKPRRISSLCGFKLIVRVRLVPRRTVVRDIHIDNSPSRDQSHTDDKTTQFFPLLKKKKHCR